MARGGKQQRHQQTRLVLFGVRLFWQETKHGGWCKSDDIYNWLDEWHSVGGFWIVGRDGCGRGEDRGVGKLKMRQMEAWSKLRC